MSETSKAYGPHPGGGGRLRQTRWHLRLLWARTGYRPTARLLHRFDLHHTRRIGPMEDGAVIHKCEWCGVSRTEHTMESIERKMRAALNDR